MGTLTLTQAVADAANYNLDTINGGGAPDDWALYTNSWTPAQRRNGGGSTIGCAFFGASGAQSSATEPRTVSWSNGTPTGSGSSTACNFCSAFDSGNGFTITVPAGTSPRRLWVLCDPFNTSPDTITASLSDGSATAINDTTSMTGASGSFNPFLVIIDYAANSNGQTLTVNFFAGLVSAQTVTLQGVAVAVTVVPPAISVQPQSQTKFPGETATFTVTASGTGTLHYQWKRNGSNVGTDTNSYTTSALTYAGDNGAVYTVDVTDDNGTTVSSNALLTVLNAIPLSWFNS